MLDGVVAISTATGKTIYVTREVVVNVAPILLTGGTASALSPSVWNGLLKFAYTHPKLTETIISGTLGTLYDVKDSKFSWEKTGENYLLGGLNAGRSLPQQLAINTSYVLVDSINKTEKTKSDTMNDIIRTSVSTVAGWKVNNILGKTSIDDIPRQIISESITKEVESKVKYVETYDEK